jgi:hypothetical protein
VKHNGIEPALPIDESEVIVKERLKLESRIKSGANWFYWIVALSGINTIIILFGGDWSFLIGLGTTQLFALIGQELGWPIYIALVVYVIVGGIIVIFWVFANKRHSWAFIAGIVLYGLDGLLFIVVQDWLSIAFHILAIIFIILGLRANIKYNKMLV